MADGYPRLVPVSDRAVLVEFGAVVEEAVHDAVLALDRALSATPIPGVQEAVPAMVNLLVLFDPLLTDHATVSAALRPMLSAGASRSAPAATHDIPVCYDTDLAPDLSAVAEARGITPEAVIAAHLAGDYSVYMYGFAPGYAYLSGTPEAIHLPRKTAPLRGVPAGSVIIAGGQCLITTLTMPTGWWIIGRSPARILTGDPARPFLMDVGDRVRFRRIPRDELGAA